MTEENTSSVGDAANTVSDGASNEETISVSAYKKLLTQRKNDQEKMRSLQESIDSFTQEKSAQEEAKLEADGEFKKINEMLKAELSQTKEDNQLLATAIQNTKKKQAFYSKLDGKLESVAYEAFIDLESIAINPETQDVDSQSVEMVVKNFLSEHGKLVEPKNAKTIPGNASSTSNNGLGYMDALKKCKTQAEFDRVRKEYGKI